MKKVIKNNIFGFILGAILFSFITAYATGSIGAEEILYDNSESGLTSENMQGAVNELYDKTNYGDAVAGNILSGKTALVGGKKVTGSIPSKAAGTYYATTSDQTISSGQYLSGAQTIKGLSSTNYSAGNIKAGTTISVSNGNANVYSVAGTFTSDGTATAAQILKDKIAYVNGSKITGTMANNGATGGTINPGGSYTIPAGYTSGGTVKANANQNSGTYTYAANSTGGTVDMGVNNTYRYVNAANVYAKGKADGVANPTISSSSTPYKSTTSTTDSSTIKYTFTTTANKYYFVELLGRGSKVYTQYQSLSGGTVVFNSGEREHGSRNVAYVNMIIKATTTSCTINYNTGGGGGDYWLNIWQIT